MIVRNSTIPNLELDKWTKDFNYFIRTVDQCQVFFKLEMFEKKQTASMQQNKKTNTSMLTRLKYSYLFLVLSPV